MIKGLVSVVMPTYKASDRLLRAVQSVLDQSYDHVELIVVDDNSPGSPERKYTAGLMDRFANNTSLQYILHDKNSGGSAARNTGFKASSGEYICLLDDDDFFYPEKLQEQVLAFSKKSGVRAVSSLFVQNGEVVSMDIKSDYTEELLTAKRAPHTSSLMFKRSVFEELRGFNVEYKRHQDYEFLMRYFRRDLIHVINEAYLEVDGSGNDNRVSGDALVEIKGRYLTEFSDVISQIDKRQRGFGRRVYAANYTQVVFAYLRDKRLSKAASAGLLVLRHSGLSGIKALLKRSYLYMRTHSPVRVSSEAK